MPADFTFSGITVAPGRQTWWFTLGPQETIPTPPADVKLAIEDYAQARSVQGPVYYYGTISNLGTEAVTARMFGVYFPEFQSDWEM
jgi:hypothetical protein